MKSNKANANKENIEEMFLLCQDLCFWINNTTFIFYVIFSESHCTQSTLQKVYDNS